MKYKRLKEVIEEFPLMDYINYFNELGTIPGTVKKVGNNYRIEPNPFNGSRDSFNINVKTNLFKCFSTNKSGNIYNLLLDLGFSHAETLELLNSFLKDKNIKIKDSQSDQETGPENNFIQSSGNRPEKKELDINFERIYLLGVEGLKEEQENLFKTRGISDKTIKKYRLGYLEKGFNEVLTAYRKEMGELSPFNEQPNKYLDNYKYIIPITKDYFILRPAVAQKQYKEYKLQGYEQKYFNESYLNLENEIIFICEGIFDSLSLEELGYKAISTAGITGQERLINLMHKNNTYVIAFDNDDAGRKATQELTEKIREKNLLSAVFNFDNKHKDINEYLQKNKKGLEKELKNFISELDQQKEKYTKPDLTIYKIEEYLKDLEENKKKEPIKTNLDLLDDYLNGGLYTGLYVIGAISSLGKTTFINQLTDDIASTGQDILFFSLEMGRNEMISKSLSREMYRIVKKDNIALSALEIQNLRFNGTGDQMKHQKELLREAIKKYGEMAKHVSIIEGGFETGVKEIKEKVERYISLNGVKPIVVIDYLQILSQPTNFFSDKQAVDWNITQLKKISRDNDLVIFVISSFNRDSYLTPVSFSSFKESGAIEYTADVVLGLELSVMKTLAKNPKKEEKEKEINEAKAKMDRQLDLVALKNRFGSPYFRIELVYYPKFNYFVSKRKHDWKSI